MWQRDVKELRHIVQEVPLLQLRLLARPVVVNVKLLLINEAELVVVKALHMGDLVEGQVILGQLA